MPSTIKKSYLLLSPGPVPLRPAVREILSEQSLYHRGENFQSLLSEIKLGLQDFFQTKESVMTLTSSGTGAMEAAVVNTLSRKDKVLCVCSGKFSKRWQEICEKYELEVYTIEVPWGQTPSAKQIQETLKKHTNIKACFIAACETSTATNQDLPEISKILKQYPETLFVVDGITGLGSMDLKMDEFGIDILIGGSQKSLSLPTGLSFIALSKKAWKFQKKSTLPKYYFDLEKVQQSESKGQSVFSINANLLKALKESLNFILKTQGLQKNIARCQQLALSTQAFSKILSLELLSKSPSAAVTAIKLPKDLSGNKIKKSMEIKHNIIVAGGQDILKDKIIRFGHLGFIQNEDLLKGLRAFGEELNLLNDSQFPKNKIEEALAKAQQILDSIA